MKKKKKITEGTEEKKKRKYEMKDTNQFPNVSVSSLRQFLDVYTFSNTSQEYFVACSQSSSGPARIFSNKGRTRRKEEAALIEEREESLKEEGMKEERRNRKRTKKKERMAETMKKGKKK